MKNRQKDKAAQQDPYNRCKRNEKSLRTVGLPLNNSLHCSSRVRGGWALYGHLASELHCALWRSLAVLPLLGWHSVTDVCTVSCPVQATFCFSLYCNYTGLSLHTGWPPFWPCYVCRWDPSLSDGWGPLHRKAPLFRLLLLLRSSLLPFFSRGVLFS